MWKTETESSDLDILKSECSKLLEGNVQEISEIISEIINLNFNFAWGIQIVDQILNSPYLEYNKPSLNVVHKFLETEFKQNNTKENKFCCRLIDLSKS